METKSSKGGRAALRGIYEPVAVRGLAVYYEPLLLVGFQEEMRGGGGHAADCRKFFVDEARHPAQGLGADEDQKVVPAAHKIAGVHLVEPADALREPVKAAVALGIFFLGERFVAEQFAGVALIVAAVVTVILGGRPGRFSVRRLIPDFLSNFYKAR